MKFNLFFFLIPVAISINFFIESYSWVYKSKKIAKGIGKAIGISNMILYSSRLFNFLFVSSAAYLVDSGISGSNLFSVFLISGLLVILTHGLFLFKEIVPAPKIKRANFYSLFRKLDFRGKLFFLTTFSAFIFFLSYVSPYIIASLFPDYRLTITSLGTLGNFIATIPLVFVVDKILYQSMDTNEISILLKYYYFARFIGFTLATCFLIILKAYLL